MTRQISVHEHIGEMLAVFKKLMEERGYEPVGFLFQDSEKRPQVIKFSELEAAQNEWPEQKIGLAVRRVRTLLERSGVAA